MRRRQGHAKLVTELLLFEGHRIDERDRDTCPGLVRFDANFGLLWGAAPLPKVAATSLFSYTANAASGLNLQIAVMLRRGVLVRRAVKMG